MPDRGPMNTDEGKVGLLDAFILFNLSVGHVSKLNALGCGLRAEALAHLFLFFSSNDYEEIDCLIKALTGYCLLNY